MTSLTRYHRDIARISRARHPYPAKRFSGAGIVICAGGKTYYTCGWVLAKLLRRLGCTLPIEVWYRGRAEMSPRMAGLLESVPGVRCVDAHAVAAREGGPRPRGWETKPYAIIHSRFERVLFIDCDNVPTRDPSFLLRCRQFRETGALFWPDRCMKEGDRYRTLTDEAWEACDVPKRDEPEFESGQMVIDKRRCWHALQLAMFYNQHSSFFYRFLLGDKDTFHMAWRRVGQDFAMPLIRPAQDSDDGPVLYQHDFRGRRLFQHRNQDKWSYDGGNSRIPGFAHESFCLRAVKELRRSWDGAVRRYPDDYTPTERQAYERIVDSRIFRYGYDGYGSRLLEFRSDFTLGIGRGKWETVWEIEEDADGSVSLALANPTRRMCVLAQSNGGWKGNCLHFNRAEMAIDPIGHLDDRERRVAEQIRAALGHVPPQNDEGIWRVARTCLFVRLRSGRDPRLLELRPDHTIGRGADGDATWWYVEGTNGSTRLVICGEAGPACQVEPGSGGDWQGHSLDGEWASVRLVPVALAGEPQDGDYYSLEAAGYYELGSAGYYELGSAGYYAFGSAGYYALGSAGYYDLDSRSYYA